MSELMQQRRLCGKGAGQEPGRKLLTILKEVVAMLLGPFE